LKISTLLLTTGLLINHVILGQQQRHLYGTVVDGQHESVLPFSSVSLKNHPVGTVSDENGRFTLALPENVADDTLMVSFIGYKAFRIPVNKAPDTLYIALFSNAIQLEEVVVYPLSPTALLRLCMQNLTKNYPDLPFGTTAYYREKFTENGDFLKGEEALFKSYYPSYQDTVRNQHQILLHRSVKDPISMAFMKKNRARELKKAEKKKDTAAMRESEINMDEVFGGPETILRLDLIKSPDVYLDSNQFKYFDYYFGKSTIHQDRELIVVHFESKRVVNHVKASGKILIDATTKAIVSIQSKGKFIIPLYAKPILFAMGLRIRQPHFEKELHYEFFQGKWYPKNFHWHLSAQLTKQHLFSPNEHSYFEIGQLFVVQSIDLTDPNPIPTSKRFVANKKMKDQVHSEPGVQW
jgi:hypothetical protein